MIPVEPRAAATAEQLAEQLNALGGLEVKDGGATRGAVTVRTLGETLEAATHVVAGAPGARLADMFADNGGDAPTLRLVWALESGYLLTETEIDGDQYPALSDIAPAAFVEECEIYEQFGIRPATGKPLNRLMLPPHAGPTSRGWGTGRRSRRKKCTPRIPWAGRPSSSRSGRSGRSAWRACTTGW